MPDSSSHAVTLPHRRLEAARAEDVDRGESGILGVETLHPVVDPFGRPPNHDRCLETAIVRSLVAAPEQRGASCS